MAGLIGDPAAENRADFGQGLQMAEGFMQNYWRAKEMRVNQERWIAGQAARNAQLEAQRLQNAAMVNAAAKQERQAKAMAGLLELDTMAAAEDYDPSVRKFVVDYAAKNPDVADTPVYKNVLSSFDKAEATQVRLEMQQKDLQSREEIAALKNQLSKRDTTPTTVTDKFGNTVMVTAGGAVMPLDKLNPVEKAEMTADSKRLEAAAAIATGGKALEDYNRMVVEFRNKWDKVLKAKTMTKEDREREKFQSAIEGQDPEAVGNLPTNPPPATVQPAGTKKVTSSGNQFWLKQ